MYLQWDKKRKVKDKSIYLYTCTKIRKNYFTMKNREWFFVKKMEEIY